MGAEFQVGMMKCLNLSGDGRDNSFLPGPV